MLEQDRLKELFHYNPNTGQFIHLKRKQTDFTTKTGYTRHTNNKVGTVAGSLDLDGYRKIYVDGYYRLAQKLAWLYMTGEWLKYPEFEVDHENGNRDGNEWANLRKVTKSQNQRNGSMRINNKSGVIGVNWVESKQAWIARIWDGPHHKYLGQFYDIEEARQARATAEIELGYHQGHGKPRAVVPQS